MSRDYKDYKNSYHRPTPKKGRWPAVVVIVLILMVTGGMYAAYLHEKNSSNTNQSWVAWVTDIKAKWLNRHAMRSRPLTMAEKEQQKNEVHFDFYTELPKMQVGVPEVSNPKAEHAAAVAATANPAIPTPVESAKPNTTASYIVEIATFNDIARASELRISLLLAGIEADVVKVKAGDKIVYSVQQGPYATAALAKASQRRLQQKGFTSVVH